MSQSAVNTPDVSVPIIPTIGIRELLPWALFAAVLGVVAIYFIGAEQGAFSVFSGTGVHEWTHDGRHLLGFPCH